MNEIRQKTTKEMIEMKTNLFNSKKAVGIAMAAVLLFSTGCAGVSPTANDVSEDLSSEDSTAEAENSPLPTEEPVPTESPQPTATPEPVPDILTQIQIEAGTPEIKASDFFAEYEDQEIDFESPLTEEDLMAVGSVYEIEVSYLDQIFTVSVEIIDTTPPEISGITALSVDAGDSISYKKNIETSDNSNGEITLTVDSSEVDLNTPGTYPVYYTAEDPSGNQTTAETTVTVNVVIPPEEADTLALAQGVIAKQVTSEMSQWDMAYALWYWCRYNIRYTSTSTHYDEVWQGAYQGLKKKSGDCYVFYATYSYLLTCCGIENMKVTRINGTSNHYWNLVNVGNGWYHCDSSPRRTGDPYVCFMQTDAQVKAYTDSYPEHPNYYTFDESLYPERGTEIVFGDAPPTPEPIPETEQEAAQE